MRYSTKIGVGIRNTSSLEPLSHALRVILGTIGMAAHGHAATLTVNTTADASPPAGACSLRMAIDNANNNATTHPECQPVGAFGADTILFDPAAFPPNTLTASTVSGQLILTDTSTTTISGGGVVALDGGGKKRIFFVRGAAYLESLTIRNAYTTYGGAGIYVKGGTVTVDHCSLSGNISQNSAGGAIDNAGQLTVTNSTLSGNLAPNTSTVGGAIVNFGTLTILNSSLTGNSAGRAGGGIYTFSSVGGTTITNSLISGNTAHDGGGIFYQDLGSASSSGLVISASTLIDNHASEYGGGILIVGGTYNNPPGVTPTLTNDTFYGNTAGTSGGAIYSNGYSTPAITNTTFFGNSAATGSVIVSSKFATTFLNSIVANSTGGLSCSGIFADGGSNIDDGASCGFTTAAGSLSNTNPQLLPLANNAGPTPTMALAGTSPALHAVGTGVVCPSVDQRGLSRPSSRCDIGAYEETIFYNGFQ